MKNLVEPVVDKQGDVVAYSAYCPGCKMGHVIYVKGRVVWGFNGNLQKPTFTPSLMVNRDLSNSNAPRCHSFIRDGQWQFLNDCTHSLKGKTVPMQGDDCE
ncbi:DUF6527 family protein [Vibrio parahaemolyticus]|uniref:DUF6527 family protein n=1 Tax=Vibrio parahaemolyticus TaxID=670 RepID=UPI000C9BE9E1|nr:DUF6527 family protein [Vibrio parahaemolyticus]PMS91932.1 anaerobic dehydrogenase [Vibrio parahaemolyticus]